MKKFFSFLILSAPYLVFSAGYQPLVSDTPLKNAASSGSLQVFLKTIYDWGVSIAVALAILFIIFGGIEYMTTDSIFKKGEGKKKITAAVAGLLIVFSSWIILNQINPKIFTDNSLGLGKINIKNTDPITVGGVVIGDGSGNKDGDSDYETGNKDYTPGNVNFSNLADYQKNNNYIGVDGSGKSGSISPEIAWMRDNVPQQFSNLKSASTYRSAERNAAVGGSSKSAHLSGQAIDFSAANQSTSKSFKQDGNNLVNYMLKNGSSLGVKQIIFEDKNYKWNGSSWDQGSPIGGHYDHVHIGR